MSILVIDLETGMLNNQRSKGQRWLLEQLPLVQPDDCLDYPYAKDELGYGLVGGYGAGKSQRAHILAYIAVHGMQPEVVMHTCDNPSCVNPHHLKAGTKADNNKDRALKGRSAKTVPSRQKLTAEDVAAIRARWQPGKPPRRNPNGTIALAQEYGVDPKVIHNVVHGRYSS